MGRVRSRELVLSLVTSGLVSTRRIVRFLRTTPPDVLADATVESLAVAALAPREEESRFWICQDRVKTAFTPVIGLLGSFVYWLRVVFATSLVNWSPWILFRSSSIFALARPIASSRALLKPLPDIRLL